MCVVREAEASDSDSAAVSAFSTALFSAFAMAILRLAFIACVACSVVVGLRVGHVCTSFGNIIYYIYYL